MSRSFSPCNLLHYDTILILREIYTHSALFVSTEFSMFAFLWSVKEIAVSLFIIITKKYQNLIEHLSTNLVPYKIVTGLM
jgi:hypothetical protein